MPLKTSEWILAVSFSLFLLTLILISRLHLATQHRRLDRLLKEHRFTSTVTPKQFWTVAITGAVTYPGSYSALHGTPLSAVLKKAAPLRFANLRGIDRTSAVISDLSLTIEELTTLQVYIEGAVQHPTMLEMPVGSRLCHLKSKIEGTSDTEWTFFKKRRLLRDGEIIDVPTKTCM